MFEARNYWRASGKRQFEYLLDDLKRLSEIAFDYVSPTVAHRHVDNDIQSNALTERFNYYRHLVLKCPITPI
jgi:hypothetical protein